MNELDDNEGIVDENIVTDEDESEEIQTLDSDAIGLHLDELNILDMKLLIKNNGMMFRFDILKKIFLAFGYKFFYLLKEMLSKRVNDLNEEAIVLLKHSKAKESLIIFQQCEKILEVTNNPQPFNALKYNYFKFL